MIASLRSSVNMLPLLVLACVGLAGAFAPQPQSKAVMISNIISSSPHAFSVQGARSRQPAALFVRGDGGSGDVRSRRPAALFMQEDGGSGDDMVSDLSTPLDRPVLAAVDVVALLGFAAVGKASHSADGSLDIGAVASVAFPFVTSWLLTSPLTGVYTEDAKDGNVVSESFLKAAKGWIIAVPLGIALRGVIKGYVPPLPFCIVTMIATLVIVGGARVLFAFAEDFFVEMVN